MKTIKNLKTGKLQRVSDKEAQNLVGLSGWQYCPKNEWKTSTREVPKEEKKEKKEKKKKEGD
jgi:hypothetical protein